MNSLKAISNLFSHSITSFQNQNLQQIRTKWVNRWMIRDVKRRKMATEMAPARLRVNSLRRNDILPQELREIADAEIAAFPLNSTPLRINKRCVVTSRPRGVVNRWRVSRIVFRHLADYNKLSGVQRAMW
ncbi:small ribosomal subunit protein uS14m [Tribolium castaneum]|uniref:28S ribosomal protein S14, mitochondrial n=1 Tax=Tribolium castaneum TaxID=7070 RepID=D6WKQ4_TRICA|nr:PREDICTED: 28S ribosomal protein S14, mitochondrial [Tribolium castaneum]EFA04750.1 28S ribosomal protein S14, mitochondrial-like Protein [Tribolium castaneum]|eukprot:XP_008200465.1 PREDICTED: 28S ribosomal protein S14, mitochondrial [Tribolium castaneum]